MADRKESLREAARMGNIDRLYELIAADPKLLDRIDENPFEHTPLHIAAEAGCTHFAIEIMQLKPSFGSKLNPEGLSPLHLALQRDCTETVRRLVRIDRDLIRVKGKEGWTPLHYVAKMDNVDLLAEFLVSCVKSINDLTNQLESAVHIAVANGNVRALKVLMGWLHRTHHVDVLNWTDEKGDTLLRVAASNYRHYSADNLLEVLKLLSRKITQEEKNPDGLKASNFISQSHLSIRQKETAKKILEVQPRFPNTNKFAEFLSSPESIWEKLIRWDIILTGRLSLEMVNALLVVATIIVTSTYQAALQPPKFTDRNSTVNKILFGIVGPNLGYFLSFNTMTFALSIGIILYLVKYTWITMLVHTSLISLYINYIVLIYFQEISTQAKVIAFSTYIPINVIWLLRYGMFVIKNLPNIIKPAFRNRVISRLDMQYQTVDSIFS